MMNCMLYVPNHNITRKYFCGDGVHLTETGVNIFADNIVNYLNEVVLGVNINKLDWHGKMCSEEKYGAENFADKKYDFYPVNLNQVVITDLKKIK